MLAPVRPRAFARYAWLLPSWSTDVAEQRPVNKPTHSRPQQAKPLSAFADKMLNDVFAKQGFASTELVARWPDIVGPEISAHSEPEKIKWPRRDDLNPEPATLVLRVEGPAALEVQHLSSVILERVNQFFGWKAVGRVTLRQAPLSGQQRRKRPPPPNPETVKVLAAQMPDISDDDLRQALARLGASIKRS